MLKVALVKQEIYPDLYVCNGEGDIRDTLFSSNGRVGPIGLFESFKTDFIIVKEEFSPECQMWRKVIPQKSELFEQLKYKRINELEGQEMKQPGSSALSSDFAVTADSVNWEQYDIVISINCSVPQKIVSKHPQTLWAYMVGEANVYVDKAYFGYDVSLNQNIRGFVQPFAGVIDFPYTFTSVATLEHILEAHLERKSHNTGIYAEVNCVTQRPVKEVPHFVPMTEETGHPIVVHSQLISENLQRLYDSKYFVKIGGRETRGNSLVESISAGTLSLMDPRFVYHTQLLPEECWVFSVDDVINKIKYLDSNHEEYIKLLNAQRSLLKHFVYDCPKRSLIEALERKRAAGKPNRFEPLWKQELKAKVKEILT